MKGKRTRRTRKPSKQIPNPLDTIAGRVVPLLESFWLAVGRARGKASGEPELSAGLPPWCHKIADQFAKTILKSTIALDPKGQFDARNFGRMIGLFLRAGVFVCKEMKPMLHKEGLLNLSKSEEATIEEYSGLELLLPIASKKRNLPITNKKQLFHQLGKHVDKQALNLVERVQTVLVHIWGQSIEEQHQFLCGIAEGFMMLLDGGSEFVGDRGRTKFYLSILVLWPEIGELQKADPPKSRRDLQQWLTAEKQIFIANDAWFDDVCDEIGLVMKGVGRKARPEI